MACSNQCAKEYVDRARVNLVGHLQNLPLIVEKLHQQKVLNSNEVSVIEAESENFNKTRKILDELWKKGEEACYQFLKILDFERKSVLAPTLHSWITLFPFRDEPEDDYIHGPSSCLEFQTLLKKNAKQILDRQWKQNVHFFGAKRQEKFTYIPVVLDTDTENNTSQNKIALKNKKSKKPRSKKMRSYIPRDTSKKSPEDLLNSKEKSILLVGKPGIGKTTVVKQMLHLWTERCDRSLDFMFYLDDNILSNDSTISTLENLLLFDTVLPNALRKKTEEILEYLQENSEKVTIIFDGISDLHNNRTFQKILEHDLLPEAKIIVTCRPETDIEDFSEWPTLKLDVQGFSEESIYAFFTQVQDCDPDLINSVLNNPALLSLCHVPMHAFMVGASFSHYASEGAQRLCTSTELYVRIFRHCIQRHGKMKLRYLEAHIEGNRNAVLDLAQRAFCKIKSKPINLQFNCKKNCVADAFLRSVSVMSPARSETFCAFLHNTMQEFFSALWLLDNPSELDEALQLCQTKESEHIKYVIPFLCGLQSETSSALLKCLFPPEQLKGSFSGFFEKISNTFLCQQPDEGYSNGVVFICQCLYEFQSSEACRQFLERVDYQLDLREEHLDPHQCCAVSYVISQSRNQLAHLDLENSFVSFSGLKTIFRHSQNLRDWSTTLCQVWMVSLESEQQNYLINLLQLCGNEIHLQTSINDEMLKKAGNIIIQSAEKINLHLHSDGDLQHLNDRLCRIIVTWLASINSLHFVSKQNQSESAEEWEKRVRSFKVNLCLQAALGQRETIQTSMRLIISDDSDEKTEFLLDLYSHLKQYETKTGRSVLPALLPVYQSAPAEWIIDLSERKAFLLLEVLKLQTVKKAVKLRGWSNQDFEVWTVLQCLPYISQLSFTPLQNQRESAEEWEKRVRSFKVNLCLQAALYQRETIQTSMRLIISDDSDEKTQFLLDLYSHMKQDETETGRSVLPALLPVYQSAPAEWIIDLSERNSSLLLEVLKLQTVKKPVKLRGWSGGESAVRSFLQCLPYISRLRYSENVAPFIRKLAVDYAEDAELVTALLTAMNSTFTISEVLPNSKCWAMGRVLGLLASPINLTLNPQAISLSGAALLFRCVTHLHKLCLGESVVEVMAQAFRAEKARAPLVIEELSVDLKTVCSAQRLSRVLGSLSSLLNLWNVQCLNLTGCEMEAHSLIDLVCHPRSLTIRVSKQTLQQLAVLVSEVKDRKLACFFLKKVGGDLSSCSLSWEELIYFLQQQVCGVTVNGKKSKITNEHVGQLLPLLDQVHWKRVSSSVVLSIIREIYETRSAHCVPSLLNSVKYCISLNGRELDPVHCAALRFTLQHCTPVSLSLLWTSIPEGELKSFLPLLSSISHLSVDRRLLLRLLHCCSLSKIQKGAEALVLCSLKNRLDFSCCIGLDLTTETQSSTLHLTPKDCSVITMAIQTAQKHTELILVDCEIEDAGVDMLFPVLHTVRLRCSKALLLQFLALVHVGTERESMVRAASLSHALGKELDLSETKLDKQTCRSLALVLEHTEGLSELDISHCQLTDHCLELLLPHLHKVDVLDLSHNDISDTLAGRIYSLVSASSNIETVRLFNNRITNQQPFLQDERFEIW
ncbi:uncharacterized protein [Salminus brasiliensis]|uniref:uncharacterized protein isoform X3 n=1 Tax=Salminus brasiliensis TaxID=930266 RepID=UPI003B836116